MTEWINECMYTCVYVCMHIEVYVCLDVLLYMRMYVACVGAGLGVAEEQGHEQLVGLRFLTECIHT